LYHNKWKFEVGDLVTSTSTVGMIVDRNRRGCYVEARPIRYIEEDWYQISGCDGLTWHIERELVPDASEESVANIIASDVQ